MCVWASMQVEAMTRRYDVTSRSSSSVAIALSLLFVVVIVRLSVVTGFYLQGSRTSYVRLPRWHSCSNSSLRLDFWTSLSDALLVYADDGGRASFFYLAVDNGSIVARISVAKDDAAAEADHTSTTLRVRAAARPVGDRHWHTVCSLSSSHPANCYNHSSCVDR